MNTPSNSIVPRNNLKHSTRTQCLLPNRVASRRALYSIIALAIVSLLLLLSIGVMSGTKARSNQAVVAAALLPNAARTAEEQGKVPDTHSRWNNLYPALYKVSAVSSDEAWASGE